MEEYANWSFTFYNPGEKDLFFAPLVEMYGNLKNTNNSEKHVPEIFCIECSFVFGNSKIWKVEATANFVATASQNPVTVNLDLNNLQQTKKLLAEAIMKKME
jgi:hypothetical protein